MFKYYKTTLSENLPVPDTYGRYVLSMDGILLDMYESRIVQAIDHKYVLPIPWFGDGIQVSKLVAVVFKGWYAPLEYVHKCDILFADTNPNNLHPKNLIWKFPKGGLEVPVYPGYYFIPSFTRYAINKKGDVLSLSMYKNKVLSHTDEGYLNLGLSRDDGKWKGCHLHRAIALTFLEYDHTINKLVVNHKDGNGSNNTIDNLEWVSYSANVLHGIASAKGYNGSAKDEHLLKMYASRGIQLDNLVNRSAGYELKDIITDEVEFHETQLSLAKRMNVSPGIISFKLSGNCVYPVISDRYIVRTVGNNWPVWDKEFEYSQAKPKVTIVENIATGEKKEYLSAKDAYSELGFSKKVVTTRLRNKDIRPYRGYIFYYKVND